MKTIKSAGIFITSSKMQFVLANKANDLITIDEIKEIYFDEEIDFNKDKESKIQFILQAALNEFLIQHSLNDYKITISLPSSVFIVDQMPFESSLLKDDFQTESKFNLSFDYPYIDVENYNYQYVNVGANSLLPYNSTIVIGVQKRITGLLVKFAKANSLQLSALEFYHLSSERTLHKINEYRSYQFTLSIYLFNKEFSFIIAYNNKPIFLRKLEYSNINVLHNVLHEVLNKSCINLSINKFENVFICGENLTKKVSDLLENTFNCKLDYFNPFEKFDFSKIQTKQNLNNYSPALGAALKYL